MRLTLFADVLLPLPVQGYFTYRVPFELNEVVAVGKRAVVQFGKTKVYTALIRRIHETPPATMPKYIMDVLDVVPIVFEQQFSFWEWMAAYYCCTAGEVMNAALPSAFKLASETRLQLIETENSEEVISNEKEQVLINNLRSHGPMTITQASGASGISGIYRVVKSLIDKGIIVTDELIKEKYKPKTETYVSLSEKYNDINELEQLFAKLEKKAGKQLELLVEFVHSSQWLNENRHDILQSDLLKRLREHTSAFKTLVKNGILVTYQSEVSRLQSANHLISEKQTELSPSQSRAYTEIQKHFSEQKTVLLHGVTSSGKTEIYCSLIDEALAEGKQVLYLLPEIALTTQIINRLRKRYGDLVGVYHSRFDENERYEIWMQVVQSGQNIESSHRIVLGARSSVFVPFTNLGLVIIDEEHDTSFKQIDPAPRYQGRDAAIYLASLHKAQVILGSATPSVESYFNTESGKWALVELTERFGGIRMPEISVINLREEKKKKKMQSLFSELMIQMIEQAVARNEQAILFQNRRGFSLQLECDACEWVPQCTQCDVTLVYHKKQNRLRCHYCGFSMAVPSSCPDCGSTRLQMKGYGTEQVEEELSLILPKLRVSRLDLDSTRSKNSYQRIITDFEEGYIDVLTGTQMVTKGLDFDKVALVGILNADGLINFPDFRAYERAFQLMAQVAGRAGRKNRQGMVLIQTFNPTHPVIQYVIGNDYKGMYENQIADRKRFKYPPFYRLIHLTIKHTDHLIATKAADSMAAMLRKSFASRILGPESPPIGRLKNFYLRSIYIKLEKGVNLPASKEYIVSCIRLLNAQADFKSVRVVVDVDPV